MTNNVDISRRIFIQTSAITFAGLTLGIHLTACNNKSSKGVDVVTLENSLPIKANAFVKIGRDNRVTVIIKHVEMGQGSYTGLSTLVAEEMDADWGQIICETAPVNPQIYGNKLLGGTQQSGGSTAMAASFELMREAGAVARFMLVNAAADLWHVNANEIVVSNGVLSHRVGFKATFGELAQAAVKQHVPKTITLKDPKDFKLIGRNLPRKDIGKTNGTAVFTQDIQLPDMLTAVVAHPPLFGATLKKFDDKAARQVNGVVDVIAIPTGVAVIAHTFWQAKKGRDALRVDWDESEVLRQSSDEIMIEYLEQTKQPGLPAKVVGSTKDGFAKASKVIESHYQFPYLAHATMEPMNCVAQVYETSAHIWHGAQAPGTDRVNVARVLGMEEKNVSVTTVFAGGSFGRRSNSYSDFVVEAVRIAKAYPGRPIKLVWTREDDILAGQYRPMYAHRLKAGLDVEGNIVSWEHRIVGQSIMLSSAFSAYVQNNIDFTSIEGAVNPPYKFDNMTVELTNIEKSIPVLWWRSVGSSHAAYATETFMDELAFNASKDPIVFRQNQLGDDARYASVINLVLEKSDW